MAVLMGCNVLVGTEDIQYVDDETGGEPDAEPDPDGQPDTSDRDADAGPRDAEAGPKDADAEAHFLEDAPFGDGGASDALQE